MSMKHIVLLSLFVLLMPTMVAADDDDWEVLGVEVEEILTLLSGVLAIALCAISFLAYKRTKSKRLLFVTIAFSLFALQALLDASELIIDEIEWLDPVGALLSFAILLAFFWGVVRR